MVTILNKIFFGGLFIFLSWKGFDGLIINLFYHSTETYDILELEQSDEIDSRNIEIRNGIAYKEDFIFYESDQYSLIDVVYPLLSHQQNKKYHNSESVKIKVLVRLNNQHRSCISKGNCIPQDSILVKGMVRIGLDNLSSSDFKALETELVTIDENVILLEPNEEPIIWYWNLLMFVVGTVFGFTILKSFFRRASSLKDYWKKITEKEES